MKMMMTWAILATGLAASIVDGSPITITGGGTFAVDSNGGNSSFSIHFQGVADDDPRRNVFMHGDCIGPLPACIILYSTMGSVINDTYFGPGFYSFSFLSGTVTGYNTQRVAVLSESIDGVVTITSRVCDTPLATHICSGTFSISPSPTSLNSPVTFTHAPEPSTFGMVFVALGMGIWARKLVVTPPKPPSSK